MIPNFARNCTFVSLTIVASTISTGKEPSLRLGIYGVEELPVYRATSPGNASGQSESVFDPSYLVQFIKASVEPVSWSQPDGASIRIDPITKALFIRQTEPNHQQIASIIHRMRLFSRPMDQDRLREQVDLAGRTNRRVVLLIAQAESPLALAAIGALDSDDFAKVAQNYLLHCIPEHLASTLRMPAPANANDQDAFGPGLWVLDGKGALVDYLAITDDTPQTNRDDLLSRVKQFLSQSEVPLPEAGTELVKGLRQAAEENKRVLFIVTGPGCVHCIRLKVVLDLQRPIVEKDYVRVIVDTRMANIEDVSAAMGRTDDEIPWYAILEPDAKVLITSESRTGNIGFPADEEDRLHFRKMFDKTRKRISEGEVQALYKAIGGK